MPASVWTLSLHDALPIFADGGQRVRAGPGQQRPHTQGGADERRRLVEMDVLERLRGDGLALRFDVDDLTSDQDRKSTRLNSSHLVISYAVFCLKTKRKQE